MEPGYKCDRVGMCLQRKIKYEDAIGYKTVEVLDAKTRILVGEQNFRKVNIETRKSKTRIKYFILEIRKNEK